MSVAKFRIKRGDMVIVTTGKYKGQKGEVKKVLTKDLKVIVNGVNEVTRHMRPTQEIPDGKVKKTLPLHISNVALIDPSTNRAGKVSYKTEDGKKVRFFKKTGKVLG